MLYDEEVARLEAWDTYVPFQRRLSYFTRKNHGIQPLRCSNHCQEQLLANIFPSSELLTVQRNLRGEVGRDSSSRKRSMHHLRMAICATTAPHQDFRSCFSSLLAPQPQLKVYPTAGAANNSSGQPVTTFKLLARLAAASCLHCCLPGTCIQQKPAKSKGFQAEQFGWETGL